MIYWLLQETTAGPSALLSGGVVGAVVGLVGVVIGQYLTQRRHSQALQQTAELEAQRAHEAALEKYVEHMGKLLTEQQLRHAAADDHLRAVARAHTLAVLEGLDPDRKRVLLGLLHESNLIHLDKPIISLLGANLKGANLKGAHLHGANLKGADLRGAPDNLYDLLLETKRRVLYGLHPPEGTRSRYLLPFFPLVQDDANPR